MNEIQLSVSAYLKFKGAMSWLSWPASISDCLNFFKFVIFVIQTILLAFC